MPAPKQYKPGPRMVSARDPVSPAISTKAKHAVVPQRESDVDEGTTVEVDIDDITVVMPINKYEQRSLHAYGEAGVGDEDEELTEEPSAPPETIPLGEWRTECSLEGTRYRRKDSRL